ncbi:MAG: tRNA dihydrouridine synthase DusB [Candidatus Nanopelagicales bacterium]
MEIMATDTFKGLDLAPIKTERFEVSPPVVLAPMAGITNQAFRKLCREFGAGLYVSEMVTTRALVNRNPETIRMVTPDPDEEIKSVQLYGTDPQVMQEAVRLLVEENRADHIDINMGCPVPKVTRKGGGAALPWKKDLFSEIINSAVKIANETTKALGQKKVPVSVKMRIGIDEDHQTYLEASEAAARAGVAWVALHGRTANQMYSGKANWNAIRTLVERMQVFEVPVLGNGDIWSAQDAIKMVKDTGAAGVVIGRGCLGRPWIFGQLSAAFLGRPIPQDPGLAEISKIMYRHAQLLCELYGDYKGIRDIRKHIAWYLKGFSVGSELRTKLALVESLEEFETLLNQMDLNQDFPVSIADLPRGRTGSEKRVALPQGWLDSQYLNVNEASELVAAELSVSGG